MYRKPPTSQRKSLRQLPVPQIRPTCPPPPESPPPDDPSASAGPSSSGLPSLRRPRAPAVWRPVSLCLHRAPPPLSLPSVKPPCCHRQPQPPPSLPAAAGLPEAPLCCCDAGLLQIQPPTTPSAPPDFPSSVRLFRSQPTAVTPHRRLPGPHAAMTPAARRSSRAAIFPSHCHQPSAVTDEIPPDLSSVKHLPPRALALSAPSGRPIFINVSSACNRERPHASEPAPRCRPRRLQAGEQPSCAPLPAAGRLLPEAGTRRSSSLFPSSTPTRRSTFLPSSTAVPPDFAGSEHRAARVLFLRLRSAPVPHRTPSPAPPSLLPTKPAGEASPRCFLPSGAIAGEIRPEDMLRSLVQSVKKKEGEVART